MLQILRGIFFVAILILAANCFAQIPSCNLSLKGSVKDNEGNALVGAALWIESINLGSVAATDGTFTFDNLCAGKYTISIKFIGYKDKIATVDIPLTNAIKITLEQDFQLLHEIVVEGEHAQQHAISQAVSVLSSEQLDANKGKSLGELLRQLPGVSSLNTGPTIFKPVIQGLHSHRILVLNNGIRQEGQQWGIEHAPEIDPFIASEIEVVKGAETVRYGADAIGGVILVNTPELSYTNTLKGELNIGLMSNGRLGVASAMVEGGFKKSENWGWRLQGTGKKAGDFQAPNYNLSNTGVHEYDFSGTLGYKKNDKQVEIYFSSFNTQIGILRSAHTGNLNDLQSSIENQQPWYVADFTYDINNPRQKINHQLLKVKASKEIKGLGKLNILYGAQYNQRKEFDIRRGGRSDIPALSLDLFSNVIDASLEHNIKNWSGSVGINGTFRNNSNEPGTGIVPLIPDYNLYSGGLFLIEKLRKENWVLELGARFDHQYLQVLTFNNQNDLIKPTFNFDYVSGSVGTSYFFTRQSRFISNISISSRPPHVSELYSQGLHHGTASVEEGLMLQNGDWSADQSLIKKEVSKKWSNTYQFATEKIGFEVTAFVNLIDNYIYLQPTETRLTIRGYFPVFKYKQTDALLAGGDASVNFSITEHLTYTGKFSYLYARDITRDDKLPLIPPTQLENALKYSFNNTGQLQKLYISVSIPTTLKQYRAPLTIYPKDIPSYTGNQNFDFMPAPHAYTLLNIEAGGKIYIWKHDLSITLSGENLLNTSYRNYMNRLRYYADDLGRNIMLRLKYNFNNKNN
jgi:iron complex outermembrane receptor protein